MKILKGILFTILGLVALCLIVGLFVKKDYSVEREITISKPSQEVFDYLLLLKNQDHFSRWASMDPDMKKEYRGTDGTVGFISAWESDKIGKGEQEIVRITPGERIDYELRFLKPFPSTSPAYLAVDPVSGNQTRVKWGFRGTMNYPTNLMLLFMNMEAMIGDDLQAGLTNLKGILEQQ